MNTIQPLSTPPPQVRMADGRWVPAATQATVKKARRFLLVVQYYEGDREEAEDLCSLIADLERVKNRDVDICLYGRHDANEISKTIQSKLATKFEKVIVQRCRRSDAKSYPFASNQMFHDMVTLFAQYAPWNTDYFAFINLETDCTPVHPGWIGELIKAWRSADAAGKSAIGFIHDDPKRHMNGVGVYAIDMWKRVGSNKLSGGNPQVCYDIYHADTILPLAEDTPLIVFEYRRPTITAEQLFKAHRGGVEPAIFHGVKDSSAREAVRARYITFSEIRDLSRHTVFTFFHAATGINQAESTTLLDLWREAWNSRGFNPVVLTMRDAARNGSYARFVERVKKLPTIGDPARAMNRFLRWLALDTMGGGLMVDFDVIPANFNPEVMTELSKDAGSVVLCDKSSATLCAGRFDQASIKEYVAAIEAYDAEPGDKAGDKPHVTDMTVFRASPLIGGSIAESVADFGTEDWKKSRLVHFSSAAVEKQGIARRSQAIEAYLKGE